jgi:hypothetical protein
LLSGAAVLTRAAVAFVVLAACDTPHTTVAVTNAYTKADGIVVYRAFWLAARFDAPVAPQETSDAADTPPSSGSTAYALLAPGWDASGGAPPLSLVAVQSKSDLALHFDRALTISVDDTAFEGRCGSGTQLTQAQADLITQRVFAADFAGDHYDPSTCATGRKP